MKWLSGAGIFTRVQLLFALMFKDIDDISITSVDIISEEKFDAFTYVYNYKLNFDDKSNYSHASSSVKAVIEALEDNNEEKGYDLHIVHLYENDKQVW